MYIPHIPWNWAKQRPQFVAEELSKFYEVSIVLRSEYKSEYKAKYHAVVDRKMTFRNIFRLPFNRVGVIKKINCFILKKYISTIIRDYDIVWISSPEHYIQIDDLISERQILVYDCMDDILEFPQVKNNKSFAREVFCAEEKLIRNANKVICSSVKLSNTIVNRYDVDVEKIKVINNAVSETLIKQSITRCLGKESNSEYKHITYIGTIDKWFDYSLLERISDKFDKVIFDLYGPVVYKPPKVNEKIKFHGLVPHDQIADIMNCSDMLIMPFVVTPLIESVNPVKLYEYILSGKPTVAVKYEETKYFSDYVYLYDTPKEFEEYVEQLLKQSLKPLKSIDEVRRFCADNTWGKRVCEICTILDKFIDKKG